MKTPLDFFCNLHCKQLIFPPPLWGRTVCLGLALGKSLSKPRRGESSEAYTVSYQKSLFKKYRRFADDRSGAAAIEFAVVAMTVITLCPVLYDMSTVASNFISLSGSMRAGLQYTLKNPTDDAGIADVVRSASGFSTATVTNTPSCQCSGIVATCGQVCGGGVAQAQYRTLTASYNVPTMIPYAGYPNNYFTISRAVTIRVQ